MATEPRRGCGYRKVGGLYLVGEGPGFVCERLPLKIDTCPVCGEGIRISRSYRWIDASKFFPRCEEPHKCHKVRCPVCDTTILGQCLIMGVGQRYYTPESFTKEAEKLGVSKRINHVPKDFKVGETWVLLAHKEACEEKKDGAIIKVPGVFYVFRPKRIEKILKKTDATKETVQEYKKRGITVITVPDNDQDHMGRSSSKVQKELEQIQKNKSSNASLTTYMKKSKKKKSTKKKTKKSKVKRQWNSNTKKPNRKKSSSS